MGCEEIRDLLALYAGGESYDNERVAVEAHVAVCAACARELDQYREARANLSMLREGQAPPGTFKNLWSGVRADLFPQKAAPPRLAWFDTALRYAAVGMVGIAIGVLLHVTTRRDAGPVTAPMASQPSVNIASPVQPATFPNTSRGFIFRPRTSPALPRVEADGNFYLPRVESIPAGREKDF
ncbi:MAG TPA: zf-HC2 domain-containing protein [Planctomycetota bacterium]|jgi:anti-sigma factor RsiW|nr:zf-HC2 domain-containing protein [Planctomycetota bacterium]